MDDLNEIVGRSRQANTMEPHGLGERNEEVDIWV